jgi:hypothetical protein
MKPTIGAHDTDILTRLPPCTQTNGKADYPAAHAIQDQYKLMPLSPRGKPYTPPAHLAGRKQLFSQASGYGIGICAGAVGPLAVRPRWPRLVDSSPFTDSRKSCSGRRHPGKGCQST